MATSKRSRPSFTRRWPFLGEQQSRRLARAYGTRALRLLDGAQSGTDLGDAFGGGMTAREVDYLVREEWARSARDVYWLHSKTGLHATPDDRKRLDDHLAGS